MNIPIAPGVFDILPKDEKELWRSSYLWNYVESEIRKIAREYGYSEIRTPVFERTELFKRGVGETSDIVSKEMYTFDDKGGRSMSLRPEGTAPAMRAVIEHQLCLENPIQKLFYIGPMFRYERTQAGRYRQHHQFGAEAIGNGAPEQDVEIIDMIFSLYSRLGIQNLQVKLNSIGDIESRRAFREALKEYLKTFYHELSADSQTRFETNPLRILDSKDPKDQAIVAKAPSILNFLNPECLDHFQKVQSLLQSLKIPFQVNPLLVRGLDYYNKTVFEIVAGELGSQNSIVGGGRYDGLLKTLGGPDLPAFGFGTGIERILLTLLKQGAPIPKQERAAIFFIPLGEEAKRVCFSLLKELRQHHIPAQMDFSGRKVQKVMQYANQIGAEYVAVVGEDELKSQELQLKEMSTGNVKRVSLQQLAKNFYMERKWNEYIEFTESMQKPFDQPFDINKDDSKTFLAQAERASSSLNNTLNKIKQLSS